MTIGWPLRRNIIRRGLENNTFGMVRNNKTRAHQGWDFAALIGTPCMAIADGKVALTYVSKDYGRVLVCQFEHGGMVLYAAYAHLASVSVGECDTVKRGQVICYSGESGNAKGMLPIDQHLHFEIRTTPRPGPGLGGRISPKAVFGVCPLHETILQA